MTLIIYTATSIRPTGQIYPNRPTSRVWHQVLDLQLEMEVNPAAASLHSRCIISH